MALSLYAAPLPLARSREPAPRARDRPALATTRSSPAPPGSDYDPPSRSGCSGHVRVNGTYHADSARKRARANRALIAVGALLALLGIVNVALINADMARIEASGPAQLALAGSGVARFVPSILASMARPNAPQPTGGGFDQFDPRRSLPYVQDKRALERWLALVGFGLAGAFIGLDNTSPSSSRTPRSQTGTDLARILVLLSLTWAALSIFESGG